MWGLVFISYLCVTYSMNMLTNMEELLMKTVFSMINLSFMKIVMMITLLISMFSIYYMNEEMKTKSFYSWKYLFVFSMLLLMISGNWLTFFIGWDGLGVTSFMLVCFYNNMDSLKSSLITFFTNRLGDCFLFMYMSSIYYSGGINFNVKGMLIMMFMCMMTKSAQMPFSAWLPRAMAAPTPISSLVHSSTLVTAGLIMIMKNYLLINFEWFNLLFWVSLLTVTISSLMAMMETDFKKIIALSTLSQMGMINIMLSLTIFKIALFHMVTHAIFKASMFFSAGMIIHYSNNEQIKHKINVTQNKMINMVIIMSNLALMALPFTLGFFSKDLLIDYTKVMPKILMIVMYTMLATTVIYSSKFITSTLMSKQNMKLMNKHDNLIITLLPFTIFTFLIIFTGNIITDMLFFYLNPQYSMFKLLWLVTLFVFMLMSMIEFNKIFLSTMLYLSSLTAKTNNIVMFKINMKVESNLVKMIETNFNLLITNMSWVMNKNPQMMIIDLMFLFLLFNI